MPAFPDILVPRGRAGGMVWTVLLSALGHAAVLGMLLIAPQRFLGATPPALESYTVELIAPGRLGGANLIPDSGAAEKTSTVRASRPVARPPVADKPTGMVHIPRVEPKPAQAEKEKEARQQAQPGEIEDSRPEPAAAAPPVKALADGPRDQNHPDALVREGPAQAVREPKPLPEPKKEQKAKKRKKQRAAESPPVSEVTREREVGRTADVPSRQVKPAAGTARSATDAASEARDQRIAEAIEQRAAALKADPAAHASGRGETVDLEQRIVAAIRRRVVKAGVEIAAESETGGGGPISFGSGTGAGGRVVGLEHIRYSSRMEERIRAAWAWAGANRSLEAVIRFNIAPSGEITNIRTIRPSGDPSYDASAERAVRSASPLGRPPEKYRADFSTVELTFRPDEPER